MPPRTTRKQSMQLAVGIVGGLLSFNAAFFFLSNIYYADRADAADLGHVRMAFAVLTFVIGAASFTAAAAPRVIGHGIAFVLGLGSIAAGAVALGGDLPAVMGVTLVVIGALMPVLAWRSLQHSREAWAFLISLISVFAGVTFFGAPKVHRLLGVGLWTALIIPGLQIVAVIALAMVRGEYRDPSRT